MVFLKFLLSFVEALCALLLLGVILLQKPKSHGMGMAFGAGVGETLFGSQVGNVLTRTTVILAVVFLVNTTLLALVGNPRGGGGSVTDTIPGHGGAAPSPVPSEMPVNVPEQPQAQPMAPAGQPGEGDQTAVPAPAPAAGTQPEAAPAPASGGTDSAQKPGE